MTFSLIASQTKLMCSYGFQEGRLRHPHRLSKNKAKKCWECKQDKHVRTSKHALTRGWIGLWIGFLLLWRWMEVSAYRLLFQASLCDQWWIRYCSLRASTSLCADEHTQPGGLTLHRRMFGYVTVSVTYCTSWKLTVCGAFSVCISVRAVFSFLSKIK